MTSTLRKSGSSQSPYVTNKSFWVCSSRGHHSFWLCLEQRLLTSSPTISESFGYKFVKRWHVRFLLRRVLLRIWKVDYFQIICGFNIFVNETSFSEEIVVLLIPAAKMSQHQFLGTRSSGECCRFSGGSV